MEPSDNDLISRAQNGEVAAFEQLVNRYDRKVLSMALLYSKDDEDAKDIYQEAFLRIYRGLPGFRGDSLFSTWLYRIVTNVCLGHQMKNRKVKYVSFDGDIMSHAAVVPAPGESSPEQLYSDREIVDHVNNALVMLTDRQRLVFIYRHYQGLKLSEIAVIMNRAEGTIKKYLHIATRKLREELRSVFEIE